MGFTFYFNASIYRIHQIKSHFLEFLLFFSMLPYDVYTKKKAIYLKISNSTIELIVCISY